MRKRQPDPPPRWPSLDQLSAEARWIARREVFYEKALGPMRQPGVYHWDDDGRPHIDVYALAATPERAHEIMITGGMADRPQPGVPLGGPLPRRVELLLRVPEAADWAALVTRELAALPFVCGVRLHPGTLVRGSRPVTPGATLSHALIVPAGEPALDGFVVEGETVTFLGVALVTEAELRYGIERGGGALSIRLGEAGVGPVVNLQRASAV